MSPQPRRRSAPRRVSVRMYGVGFGDCFLLSFTYGRPVDGRSERHLLIDFGSTRWPETARGKRPSRYLEVADDIAERTGGKLDALVITHRHTDHLAAFAVDEVAERIAALRPRLVVRPWTEDPDAAAEATGPAPPGEASGRFARSLQSAQRFAGEVHATIPNEARGLRGELRHAAREEVANQEAIDRLDEIAAAAKAEYLYAGAATRIGDLLPGVRVSVLGPPTIEQWPEVSGEREDDPEFWLGQRGLLRRMLDASAPETPPPGSATLAVQGSISPGPARWLVERMRDQHAHSLFRLVRRLDDGLNNTSLILFFEAGRRRLLFPGDAQIENWNYVLRSQDRTARRLREAARLREIDLYKVGHHGSRNATPRTLVRGWQERGRPVTSLMSTLPGVHGESEETAVPRATLVRALGRLGKLHRSDKLRGKLYCELSGSTSDRKPFTLVPYERGGGGRR